MKTVSTVLMLAIAVLLARPSVLAQDAGSANNGSDKVPLGSPDFYPSAEHPIGWRGDGTGCYPGATPPTVWFQKANGQSRNIFWKTRLPCYSWSTPIVVGDKIFTRSEPYDLLCLNKNTGKLLWIRSCPPFIGVSE
jgi:outer membrane protein assembly factor BamB